MSIAKFTPLPLVLRRLAVVRTEKLTPRMRRVTFGGPELAAFSRDGMDFPAFTSLAFDDHVKIVIALDGDIAAALPEQRENGIEWPPAPNRVTRDYTPVQVDPDRGEVSFDFVVHTREGAAGAGPAERWAAGATPGDELWIVGPKSSTLIPDDVDWALLVGDETGLPAIERFLIDRPMCGPVHVVLSVATEAAVRELPLREGDSIRVIVAEPGDPAALADAVRELARPTGIGYVWAGAESRALLPVRRIASRDWGIPKSHQNLTGYWHRVEAAETAPTAAAPGRLPAGQLLPVLPSVVHSPVSWFAVRAALRSGLLVRCEESPATVEILAADLGVPVARLDPLVRMLVAAEVLADDSGRRIGIGPGGELILGDEHVGELFDGSWADQVMMLTDLGETLPLAESAWKRRHGRSYFDHATADPAEYAELAESAGLLAFLLPALRSVPAIGAADDTATVTGPGAAIIADGLAADKWSVTIVEHPVGLEVFRESLTQQSVRLDTEWRDPGVVVGALALHARDDDEATAWLTEVRRRARTLVLIEATGLDALGPRGAEMTLMRVGVVGARPRNRADLDGVVGSAGWSIVESTPLGWGMEALTLAAEPMSNGQ